MAVTVWSEAGLKPSVQACVLRKERWQVLAVCFLAAAIYVGTSFWPVILDETDGQYAGAGREMLQRGDWLVPTNNGIPRLQKPPLVYWLTRLSLGTLGVNEFAARLPNALATVAWIFATYLIGQRVGGHRRGLFGAMMFGSMLGLFLFSHRIMPEPFLGLFISLAIWCLLSACHAPEQARRWFVGGWLFMALGVLSKGLHGALYPLLIAGLAALFYPASRAILRQAISLPGLAVFAAVTVPWYAAMSIRFPGFLGYHFFNEQVGHAFNTGSPRDCDPVPFGTFWAQHFLYLFPWLLFLPATIWAWRNRATQPMGKFIGEPILWIWILVTAVSISFSVRQDHYSMSSWGAIGICLAAPWLSRRSPARAWLFAPCMLVALLGALIALTAILPIPALASAGDVQPEAARGDIQGTLRGLLIASWGEFSTLAGVAGLIWLGGGLASAVLVRRGQRSGAAVLLAGAMALFFPIATRGYTRVQQYFSLADAAAIINNSAEPDALVVCEGQPHVSASLFFYLNRRVVWAGKCDGSELAARASNLGVDPFVSDDQLAHLWHSSRQVFLILEQSNFTQWQSRLLLERRHAPLLARSGTRMLLVNRKSPGSDSFALAQTPPALR